MLLRYRLLIVILMIVCFLWISAGTDVTGAESSSFFIKVVLNGKPLAEKGICHKGFAYIPLKALAEAMGVPYKSDAKKRSASLNGKPIKGTALMNGGIFYIPATSVGENTGAKVKFDVKNRVISITGGKAVAETPHPFPTPVPTISGPEPFIPVKAENDIFRITVTNVEGVSTVKGHYKPQAGNKYVIIYLSQQNISDEVQIYTGKYALVDNAGEAHDYIEALSNFWLLVLKPGGINFGYLVFEMPQNAIPMKVVLSTTTRPPLTLNLK